MLLIFISSTNVDTPDTFKLSSSLWPLTSNPVSVPNEVIFGWAAVIRVPVILVKVAPTPEIFPEKVVAVRTPTPKIFLLLPFKSPPSLGVASPKIVVVIPVSEVNG